MVTAEKMTKNTIPFACGLLLLLHAAVAPAEQLLDRIIAVVDQDVVMLSELRSKAQENLANLKRTNANPMPSRNQLLSRALDELIIDKLLLAEAARLGIEADQELIARAIAGIAKNNNLTVPQLRQALQDEGQDFRQFQDKIRDQLIVNRLLNREVTNRIQVTDSEIEQHLTLQAAAPEGRGMVNLLHILIATPDGASPAQIQSSQKKAESAKSRIDRGETFRAVALDTSDGRRAINGGDLGWLPIAGLPRGFNELVNSMQAGEVRGPFRSNAGFHIIKVEAFRQPEEERRVVKQTKARHILIRTNEITADSDAQARLQQLRERVTGGDDFANLARSHSDDQASAIKGGDVGWVSPGKMVPEFEEVMDATATGQVSQPFKTRFGWHILQVLERRQHDETEQARRDAARKALRDRKAEEATAQYKRRLRGEAYVDLRLEVIE